MTCVISHRGTRGACNRDKKHCCFHLELNYGLNTGLKQRKYIHRTIKGSISNFRIIFFLILSHLLDYPHVPRFNITQVNYVLPPLWYKQQLTFYLVFLFCFSCCLIPLLLILDYGKHSKHRFLELSMGLFFFFKKMLLLILTTLLSDHSVLNFNIFF